MIYQQGDQMKIQIQPMNNTIFFRIVNNNNKKLQYNWSLYQRKQSGKQQFVESVSVKLQDLITQFVNQEKKNRESVTKSKLYDSKTLSNSSKINQSNLRSTEKSFNIRKSTVSISLEPNQTKFIKLLKTKFQKTGIGLSYLFCAGPSQEQIQESIKDYILQQKLNLIGKSIEGQFDDGKYKKSKSLQALKGLQKIDQELQLSHRSIITAKSDQSKNLSEHVSTQKKSNIFEKLIDLKENAAKKQDQITQSNKKSQQQKQTSQKKQSLVQNQNSMNTQKTISNLKIDEQKQKQSKIQKQKQKIAQSNQNQNQKKPQFLTTSYLKPKDEPRKSKILTFQNNQDLYKTEKSVLKSSKIQQNSHPYHDYQLIQTTPTGLPKNHDQFYLKPQKSKNPSRHNGSSHQDNSMLKLDDVILLGKRVSYSDKSQWMKTSKSRTNIEQELVSNENKNMELDSKKNDNQIRQKYLDNTLTKNQKQSLKFRMQIESRKDEDIQFLDIVSLRPKQEQNDQVTRTQNAKQQNQNKKPYKMASLKRKSTVQQVIRKDNFQFGVGFKPKTMGDNVIQNEMEKIIEMEKINSNSRSNSENDDMKLTDEGLKSKNKQIINSQIGNSHKLTIQVPSIILQQIQQKSTFKDSSQNPTPRTFVQDEQKHKNLDEINSQFDQQLNWGQGLSQIKHHQTSKNKQALFKIPRVQSLSFFHLHQSNNQLSSNYKLGLQKVKQKLYKPYIQPLYEPSINKIKNNQYINSGIATIRQKGSKINFKYVVLVVIFLVLCWVIFGLGILQNEKRLSDEDPIFKKTKKKKFRFGVKRKMK